jgi:hypothetical protein
MTSGKNGSPARGEALLGFFIIIAVLVGSMWFGVWLQRKALGIDKLEDRVYRLETKLSE